MKKLLVLMLCLWSLGEAQTSLGGFGGITVSYFRDSSGTIVTVPAGKPFVFVSPATGTAGYWKRAGGTVSLVTAADTGQAAYFNATTAFLGTAFKGNTAVFSAATADGSDNSYIGMSGGGADGAARGAAFYLSGNERSGFEGQFELSAGNLNDKDAVFVFKTQGATRLRIDEVGAITLGSTDSVGLYPIYAEAGTFSGAVTVGGGTAMSKVLSASLVYDCGSIAAGVDSTFSITVTGAVAGNPVSLGLTVASEQGLVMTAECVTNDAVLVKITNHQLVGSIDPASRTYKVKVTNF